METKKGGFKRFLSSFHQILYPPFFNFHGNCAKFVLPIPICLAYLVPLDVDVTRNITANFAKLEVNLIFGIDSQTGFQRSPSLLKKS
jgi:hypothetical protein